MGTVYHVKLVDYPAGLVPGDVQANVDVLLAAINDSMSTYIPDSELSLFNASRSTAWTDASEELVAVLASALAISDETRGAFDITIGPLVNLWGFGPEMHTVVVPSDRDIEQQMSRVGYRKLELRASPPGLRKSQPDLYVDLSAIAKGYAVDRLADYLEGTGIDNYMVEIGGEIRAKGHNASGQAWRIAVEKPLTDGRAVHTIVNLSGSGLATSGDYRNFFEKQGRRYSHTLDPATGYPVSHELASVTVADASAMRADAMATALMVLGPQAGYEFAERNGLAALFISRSAQGFGDRATPAFSRYIASEPEKPAARSTSTSTQ